MVSGAVNLHCDSLHNPVSLTETHVSNGSVVPSAQLLVNLGRRDSKAVTRNIDPKASSIFDLFLGRGANFLIRMDGGCYGVFDTGRCHGRCITGQLDAQGLSNTLLIGCWLRCIERSRRLIRD